MLGNFRLNFKADSFERGKWAVRTTKNFSRKMDGKNVSGVPCFISVYEFYAKKAFFRPTSGKRRFLSLLFFLFPPARAIAYWIAHL